MGNGKSGNSAISVKSRSVLTEASSVTFILTADRARSKPFYAGALGLEILAEDENAVTFAFSGGARIRLTDLPGHEGREGTVLGWAVADIASAMASLKSKGVTFRKFAGPDQDADGVWTAPDGSAKVAWFADPDGNMLSITEFG